MAVPTTRQREILTKVCQTEMLVGNPAFTRDVDPMALTLSDDLNLDSLDVVELGMEIEETFAIKLEDADVDALVTISDVVRLVERETSNG
jgi:acyl carrier protein